jgi:hypothetical protein
MFVTKSGTAGGLKLLACFAPESIVPLSRGLYWEDDELKEDLLEDWSRFWDPLKHRLWESENELQSECQEDRAELDPNAQRLTLAGTSYKDSIDAVVKLWSESKEELEYEIQR